MNLIKLLKEKILRKKPQKHIHEKGAWRYNQFMEKVFCTEDEA